MCLAWFHVKLTPMGIAVPLRVYWTQPITAIFGNLNLQGGRGQEEQLTESQTPHASSFK
ncbi:hypothetical protein Cal7507_0875 [Calothrix sp. PCC 7507]|nr:hypothetical protein Cal7507_0875 [Calothrix sp. PCC 7507]